MSVAKQIDLFAVEPEPTPWERDDEADRLFAEIVFNRPVDDTFTYEVPFPLRDRIAPGRRVVAPFGRGNEQLTGYCIRLTHEANRKGIKNLAGIVDDESLLDNTMLELARWIAEHYCCAYGQALDAVLPASVKSGAGTREVTLLRAAAGVSEQLATLHLPPKQRIVLDTLIASNEPIAPKELARIARCTMGPIHALQRRNLIDAIRCKSRPIEADIEERDPEEQFDLSQDQRAALDRIESQFGRGGFHAMLLHGVTGSGKTEVYLRAIKHIVEAGKEAIVLVPEISLTPQTIRRFRSRFPHVAVLHSHLADAERHAQWRRIAAGEAQVVVGARSAIFAPTRRLGLIVIDEEHEGTFKQETAPRYHARDVAWRRAELLGVPLLLGSATPSLESWYRTQTGRCELLDLPERVLNRPLPEVKLIDLRTDATNQRRRGAISSPLEHAMRRALEAGGQVILLLNRRGFSTHIQCIKCGHVEQCPRCDISLVFHRDRTVAICHTCDLELPPPQACSHCKATSVNFHGLGTERLEQEVRAKFPGFACQRMDTDTMRGRGSHERVLTAFRRGELRILLGTQMIAKGLDFPGVTLVGVVSADTALHLPDFRAAERTFQLVAQVAGRTGRGEQGGRVLVQTFSPDCAAVQTATRHDFAAFVASELPHRREHNYPPFGRLARVIVRSKDEAAAKCYIEELAAQLRELAEGNLQRSISGESDHGQKPLALNPQPSTLSSPIRVLGPAPAPVTRVKNFYRYHLQVQGPEDYPLDQLLRPAIAATPPTRHAEIAVDVDPLGML